MADTKIQWGNIVAEQVRMAVDDVRHKVVEEGWFGKEKTGSVSDYDDNKMFNSPLIDGGLEGVNDNIRQVDDNAIASDVALADLYGENINAQHEAGKDEPEIGD